MTHTGEHTALVRLRDVLAAVSFPLPLPGAATATNLARAMAGQLDDYLIPRLVRLPDAALAPLRGWTESLARSAPARAAVIRQTLDGALAALAPSANRLAAEADAQASVAASLRGMVDNAYQKAEESIERGVKDGALFRGEVLARWQDLVGTGEFMRSLQARVGRWRDRLVSAVTGRPLPVEELKSALESHLVTFVHGAAADAAEQAVLAWQAHPAAATILARHSSELAEVGPDLDNRIERVVRDWQRWVLELIRTESSSKLFTAKASAYAVNAMGLALMIAVFAATAFIPTGAEIAVAGGTTLAAQKVLEAIFGDELVRRLANQARKDLLARVNTLMSEEAGRFHSVLEAVGVDTSAGNRIRAAASDVDRARGA